MRYHVRQQHPAATELSTSFSCVGAARDSSSQLLPSRLRPQSAAREAQTRQKKREIARTRATAPPRDTEFQVTNFTFPAQHTLKTNPIPITSLVHCESWPASHKVGIDPASFSLSYRPLPLPNKGTRCHTTRGPSPSQPRTSGLTSAEGPPSDPDGSPLSIVDRSTTSCALIIKHTRRESVCADTRLAGLCSQMGVSGRV